MTVRAARVEGAMQAVLRPTTHAFNETWFLDSLNSLLWGQGETASPSSLESRPFK